MASWMGRTTMDDSFDAKFGQAGNPIIGHIADSQLFGNGYSTDEARGIFSDARRLQRWLEVEVALARSQGELGMIPTRAAEDLASTARVELLDLASVSREIASSGHGLVPLLRAWQRVSDPEAAKYVHFGATSQDIHDTAQSLEMAESLDLIERDLRAVVAELMRLAAENRDVLTVGRTHGQHALPTTLGLKFAVWLDESLRNLERLRLCRRSVAVAQLFGGVGTMAAFGPHGPELLERFAARLLLGVPTVSWHTCRDRVAEFVTTLALVAGGLANIGNEIVQLAKSEVGEMAEPFQVGMIGSSTMPHKRNPEISERVVTLAKLVKFNAALSLDGLCNEHERDFRSVRVEWVAVTESVMYTAGALALMKHVLSGLVINHRRVEANVGAAAASICSEALMFLLSGRIGKTAAYDTVYHASLAAAEDGGSLVDLLLANRQVAGSFDRRTLEHTARPGNHLGSAGLLVDRAIARARTLLGEHTQ